MHPPNHPQTDLGLQRHGANQTQGQDLAYLSSARQSLTKGATKYFIFNDFVILTLGGSLWLSSLRLDICCSNSTIISQHGLIQHHIAWLVDGVWLSLHADKLQAYHTSMSSCPAPRAMKWVLILPLSQALEKNKNITIATSIPSGASCCTKGIYCSIFWCL